MKLTISTQILNKFPKLNVGIVVAKGIDNTGDDKWNYVYDFDTDELVEYIYKDDAGEEGKNTSSLGIIITIFAVIFFVLFKKKHPPKKSV